MRTKSGKLVAKVVTGLLKFKAGKGFDICNVKNLTKRSVNKAGISHVSNLIKLKGWVGSYRGLLLILLVSILVVRVWSLNWSLNFDISPSADGWIMYEDFLMNEGKTPYRDFLCSKPPLYFITLFLFSKAFGYGYIQAQFFAYFLVTMTVIAIYICASELFDEKIGIIAAFLGSTSIILIAGFLMLQITNLSTLLFLTSVIFLIKYLKKGINGSKRGLYLFTAGFFLGATMLVRQTTLVLVVFCLPVLLLTIGWPRLGITTVRPQKSRSNREVPILLALWVIMISFSTTLQLMEWGFVIHTSIFLGGFLLCYLFFLIKNRVGEKCQFKESIRKAIFFGVGTVSLPLISLVWLIHSGVTLRRLIFNVFDVPSYDTSIVYHEMAVKQMNAVLFMMMNPLLTVGITLYISSAIKALFSERRKLHSIDNMLRLFIVIGSISIFVLLPKFYPVYLIDVVPFMAIGAARAFSLAWKTQGLSKDLRLKSTKTLIKMGAHRRQMLLLGLCILAIVSSVVAYYPVAVCEPAIRRLEKTSNEITQAVVDYIQTHTSPDEKIFTLDHIFAALSQRRIVGDVSTGLQITSAWHLEDEFPYASPEDIIALMRNGEGKYVIMDPHTSHTLKQWAPDLFEYIMDAYTVEVVIEDVEIMGRAS